MRSHQPAQLSPWPRRSPVEASRTSAHGSRRPAARTPVGTQGWAAFHTLRFLPAHAGPCLLLGFPFLPQEPMGLPIPHQCSVLAPPEPTSGTTGSGREGLSSPDPSFLTITSHFHHLLGTIFTPCGPRQAASPRTLLEADPEAGLGSEICVRGGF